MKTAVEWMAEEFKDTILKEYGEKRFFELIEQAKEMEKTQIIDAHIDGFYSPPFRKSRNGEAKDYYNKLKE